MLATDKSLERWNSLLRGEISATETYQQALAKMEGSECAEKLRRMQVEHREAANTIRQHIHQMGGKPDQDSGVWGAWAKFVEGTAKIFGQAAAVQALREGEEQGVRDYENALKDESLGGECKNLIRMQLLPQTRDHIAMLKILQAAK